MRSGCDERLDIPCLFPIADSRDPIGTIPNAKSSQLKRNAVAEVHGPKVMAEPFDASVEEPFALSIL